MSQEEDRALYEQIKPDLIEKGFEGQFVLIVNVALVDVYSTYKEAYDAAVAKFGSVQPFIRKVELQEPVEMV